MSLGPVRALARLLPWVALGALLLAAGAAQAQDTRPTEIPYDTPGEIPQLSPKYKMSSHKVVVIENYALNPKLVTIDEGQLVAAHIRHGDIPLAHAEDDVFNGTMWFFDEVAFSRNTAGQVDGFRLSGGRVRNLRFVKLDTPLPN